MRFQRISFNNYRCFLEGNVTFSECNDKNINLLVGLNGGGKTEMLFAFWWVLYDLDFSSLQGKDKTKYSLNSDLYKELNNSAKGEEKDCSVTVELEHDGKIYEITKSEVFNKTEQQIRSHVYQSVRHTDEKKQWTPFIRDKGKVANIINTIIPKKVLYGILFDGERMQKLGSFDSKSIDAIKGVITDITNVQFIENCNQVFSDIDFRTRKDERELAKKKGNTTLEEVITKINEIKTEIDNIKTKLEDDTNELEEKRNEREDISSKLLGITETKELEQERENLRASKTKAEQNLTAEYKKFNANLKDGYLLIADQLFQTVQDNIEKYDVPIGLSTEAVRSILKRTTCICGNPLHDPEISILENLISSLPPDNMNSFLAEAIRQISLHRDDLDERLKQNYSDISQIESAIDSIKQDIATVSTKIGKYDHTEAKLLEDKYQEVLIRIGNLETEIPFLSTKEKELKKELQQKEDERKKIKEHDSDLDIYSNRVKFVKKCLAALSEIENINKSKALKKINENLKKAYKLLSEDSELNKDIYIMQYDETNQYQMVIYLQNKFDALKEKWIKDGTYTKLASEKFSEEEINEKIIWECRDSSSTGQTKMNTLAFVKAILDYSNEIKDGNSFQIQKNYPLLIDAPFSDIAGKNLVNSSKELHNFSNQVILMLDPDKYTSVKKYLEPYVSTKYTLKKQKGENCTKILSDGE